MQILTLRKKSANTFDSPCLMVGIKGQTKEMIDYDIRMLKTHFELGTVNVFTNNSTDVKRDQELVDWFYAKICRPSGRSVCGSPV